MKRDSDERWPDTGEPPDRLDDQSDDRPGEEYRRRRAPVRVRRRRFADGWRFCRAHARGLAAIFFLLLAGAALAHLFLASPWFVLGGSAQVRLQGNHAVPDAQLRQVFAADLGRNLFFIPLEQRRQTVAAIPWVKTAQVSRVWPNQLQIAVTERTPVALARRGGDVWLIDAGGMLLPPPAHSAFDFPTLNGLSGVDAPDPNTVAAVEQRSLQMQRFLNLRDQLDAGGARHSAELSEVDLSDPQDVKIVTTPPGQSAPILVYLGDHDFATRYQLVVNHIDEWRRTYTVLPYVDLRFDNRILIPTAPSPAAAPATAKSPAKGGRG